MSGKAPDPLTDAALFEREVPGTWRPLLDGLAELEALLDRPAPPDSVRRGQAGAIVDGLLRAAAPLAGQSPPTLTPGSDKHIRWFTEAALLWPDFAQAGGRVLVDGHSSGTLRGFEPDLRGDLAERGALRNALQRCFGWDSPELSRLESALQSRTSNLRLKQTLTARLHREVDAAAGSPQLAAQVLALFRRLFGPLPLRAGDVTLTLTSTALIFGLPFEGSTLLRPDFPARPEAERTAITQFLARVEKQQGSLESLRFPGFGLYEREEVDSALLDELTRAAASLRGFEGVRPRVVAETLATMVTLIPAQKAELFLVHDLWGHGWEESLCDFEWSYARLIELRDPVTPASGNRFADAGSDPGPVLRDAFVPGNEGVTIDRDILGRVVRNDLRGRIRLALNVVVAEALADLVEHKYVRRRGPADPPLPTSSLLPEAPLKTDLSLRDTQSLLRAATRPYRRLLDAPSEARRLTAELAAAGVSRDGLAEAVSVALEAIAIEFLPVFETRMTRPPLSPADPPTLAVNLAQRVMLGMIALTEALTRFLDEADAACGPVQASQRWRCPRTCIDLLVLVLGWFYEQDRQLHFWHLDELLRTELGPTLLQLERAVRP